MDLYEIWIWRTGVEYLKDSCQDELSTEHLQKAAVWTMKICKESWPNACRKFLRKWMYQCSIATSSFSWVYKELKTLPLIGHRTDILCCQKRCSGRPADGLRLPRPLRRQITRRTMKRSLTLWGRGGSNLWPHNSVTWPQNVVGKRF